MVRDNAAYFLKVEYNQRIRGRRHGTTREYEIGCRQLERWQASRAEREAVKRENERKELLAWAYGTAKARLKAQGEDAARWVEEVRREIAQRDRMRDYSRAYRAAKKAKEAVKK